MSVSVHFCPDMYIKDKLSSHMVYFLQGVRMTTNEKIISTYLACNGMEGYNGTKVAGKADVNRRNFSYLNAIRNLVTAEEFAYICDTLPQDKYVVLSTGERTRSIEGLLNALKAKTAKVVQEIDSTPMVLYVLKAGPFIKIGVAKSITNRLKQVQTGNPYVVEVAKTYVLSSEEKARAVEATLHAKYISSKAAGEWFTADTGMLEYIDQYVKAQHEK